MSTHTCSVQPQRGSRTCTGSDRCGGAGPRPDTPSTVSVHRHLLPRHAVLELHARNQIHG
eukprot:985131-Rhodomonas_salina.1